MKYLFLYVALFILNCFVHGQQEHFDTHTIRKPVFYRGIENQIDVKVLSNVDYTLTCHGCDTIFQIDSSLFSIVPNQRSKNVYLIYINAANHLDTLLISRTKVLALPNPTIYHGGTKNGLRTNRNFDRFHLEYPTEMNLSDLNDAFKIVSWKIHLMGSIYTGNGDKLSDEVSRILRSDLSLHSMSVFILAEGPDGIKRRIGAAFLF